MGSIWVAELLNWGRAEGKVKAKKKAAYMVLVKMTKAAGICEEEWEKKMWEE